MGGHGQKWVWLLWSWDSKCECISRVSGFINWFLHADTNSGELKVTLTIFGWALSKMCNILGYDTLKLAVSQKLEDELFCFFFA